MADYTPTQTEGVSDGMRTRYKDMGDGTHALVIYVSGLVLPAGNMGQQASADSLSVTFATDIADGTYIGDPQIARYNKDLAFTIPINESESNAVYIGNVAGIMLFMPAAWTAADLAFKFAPSGGGTFVFLTDEDDTRVDHAVTVSTCWSVPADSFPGLWMKLVSHDGSGNAVTQAAERIIYGSAKG